MRPYLFSTLAFGLAAAASRALFPFIYTRYQLAIFWVVAAVFELFVRKPLSDAQPRVSGFALNCLVILIAMIAVKLAIDGPFQKAAWVRRLIATANSGL